MVPEDSIKLCALSIQVFLNTYATQGLRCTISEEVLTAFTPEKFLTRLEAPSSSIRVAELNDHLIGYAALNFNSACPESPCSVELQTLYVVPRFAGCGIGTKLLLDSISQAMSMTGSGSIWLSVYHENERAIKFYQHHGFERIGTSYYEFGGERHENHVMLREGV